MKLKFFLPVAALAVLYSCKNESNEKKEYYESGSLKKKTVYMSPENKADYREYQYYQDEQIKDLNEFENGVRNGRSFSYYKNGGIKTVYYYDKGKLTSVGRFYDEKGRLTDKGLFINDSLVVKEEFYYSDNKMQVNAFSKLSGAFEQAGSLLYDKQGMFGMDHSFYYITSSKDSIQFGDSILVNVNMIARKEKGSNISLTLGKINESLQFPGSTAELKSDSLSISFYYKPEKKGYNLILGKLHYFNPKSSVYNKDFVFYHDFLAY
jgi:hypothetical protein